MGIPHQVWEDATRIPDSQGGVDQIIERLEIIGRMTNLLHEATIGRIFQHLKGGRPFAIITAYRWPDVEGSRVSTQALRHDLKSAGYSWVRARGVWEYTDDETGEKVAVTEPSYVVYGIPKEQARFFGEKYGQQGVLWGSGEEGVWILSTSHGTGQDDFLGTYPTMKNIGDVWTQLRDMRFRFAGEQPQDASSVKVEYAPSTFSDGCGWLLELSGVLYNNCPEYMVKSVLPRCRSRERT